MTNKVKEIEKIIDIKMSFILADLSTYGFAFIKLDEQGTPNIINPRDILRELGVSYAKQ